MAKDVERFLYAAVSFADTLTLVPSPTYKQKSLPETRTPEGLIQLYLVQNEITSNDKEQEDVEDGQGTVSI